jgi:hypothetical protein
MTKQRKRLGSYEKHIIKIVRCSDEEATVVEEIMRNDIFHSTLDWQTVEEFETGAREAYAVLKEMREFGTLPESYQRILETNPQLAR